MLSPQAERTEGQSCTSLPGHPCLVWEEAQQVSCGRPGRSQGHQGLSKLGGWAPWISLWVWERCRLQEEGPSTEGRLSPKSHLF